MEEPYHRDGEREVRDLSYWLLLGPFLCLLTLVLLLFHYHMAGPLVLMPIVGLVLCLRWHLHGMMGALALLLLSAIIEITPLSLNERYWMVGISLSLAFAFVIFTLALEEVGEQLGGLLLESKNRLEHCAHIDQKWRKAQEEWENERNSREEEIKWLMQDLATVQEEKRAFYHLAQRLQAKVDSIERVQLSSPPLSPVTGELKETRKGLKKKGQASTEEDKKSVTSPSLKD